MAKRTDSDKRALAVNLMQGGMGQKAVADQLKVRVSTVAYWRKKAGMTKPRGGGPPTEAVSQPRDTRIDMALSCLREIRRALEAQTGHRYSRNDHYAMLALSWLEGKR